MAVSILQENSFHLDFSKPQFDLKPAYPSSLIKRYALAGLLSLFRHAEMSWLEF